MPSFDYARYLYPPEALVWFRRITVPANSVVDLDRIIARSFRSRMRLLNVYSDNQPDIELQVVADNFQQVTRLVSGWTPREALEFDIPFETILVLRLVNRQTTDITLNIAYVIGVDGEEKLVEGEPLLKSTVSGHVVASSNAMVLNQLAGKYILEVKELYISKASGDGVLSIIRDGVETKIDLSEIPSTARIPVSFKAREHVTVYLYPATTTNISVKMKYNAYKK